MPVNYDMVISQSPPVFSHSPPTGFLSDCTVNFRRPFETPCYRPSVLLASPTNQRKNTLSIKMANTPKRSCLITHTDTNILSDSSCQSSDKKSDIGVCGRTKKRVIFADDKGLELVQVKVMSEPSNVPPFWSLQFLAHVTQGMISPVPPEQWVVDFQQPASDYLAFRQKLEMKNVSLENVIVKENDSIVVGTVKVKNLHFTKEVIVRATWDNWKSQEDIFCVFSKVAGASGAYVLYDTFSFRLTLPPASKTLEFCVCFRCNGTEFWDNNDGRNYTLSKRLSDKATDPFVSFDRAKSQQKCAINSGDQQGIKVPTWSEVSSWNQTESPYW
ncbi:protein phosphatase 1 regulatory subunit 3B [Phlebotomus papatasi]|nr:protein phosphatase 1 regulatory subunit 3B [Phlebotomus papatasi]